MKQPSYETEHRGSITVAGNFLPAAAAALMQTGAVTPTTTFGDGKWWWGRRFANIFVLALGFMFSCSAYYAVTGVANNIIHDMRILKYDFHENDGNIAFTILYAAQTLATFFVPQIVSLLGGKWSAIAGGISQLLYTANFLLNSRWYLFAASAVCGFGVNLYWTAYGVVLAENSTASNAIRYTGFFWFVFNTSQVWGSLVIALTFAHGKTITDNVRYLTVGIFIGMSVIGCAIILFVRQIDAPGLPHFTSASATAGEAKLDGVLSRRTKHSHTSSSMEAEKTAWQKWQSSLKVVFSPLMLLCLSFFIYTGVSTTLYTSPLPTSVGFNKHFGDARKQLIGTTGYAMGACEITSAFVLTFLSSFVNRTVLWTVGVVAALTAMGLMALNSPLDSTLVDSSAPTILYGDGSSVTICILSFVLFGFGEGVSSIAMMALLTNVFGHEQLRHPTAETNVNRIHDSGVDKNQEMGHGSAEELDYTAIAFAVMSGTQSLVCAILFLFSSQIWLNGYFYFYAPTAIISSMVFLVVDRNFRAGKYRNYFSDSHVQS